MTEKMRALLASLEEKGKAVKALTEKGALTEDEFKQADQLQADQKSIMEQVDAEKAADARLAAIKSGQAGFDSALNDPATGVPFRTLTPGAAQDDKTKSLGDWMATVGNLGRSDIAYPVRERLLNRLGNVYKSSFNEWDGTTVKAALAEGAGITGGYTAPPEYSSELLKLAIEDTVFVGKARQIPMSNAELHIPTLNQTGSVTAGQTQYTGGMVASWTAEAASRSETEPTFKSTTLKPYELSGYTVASRTLLADNVVALESLLKILIKQTVDWYLDFAALQGNGVGKPTGVLGHAATIGVGRTTSNLFKLADAANMVGKLLPASRKSAIWVMAQDVFAQLVQLADASGRVVFLPNYGGGPGPATVAPDSNMMLLGRPVYFTEKLPALGTAGDVMLIDPSYYLLGMRAGLEIVASEHYKFINNQMTWRFLMRADGQPWLDAPFKLQDGTRTISPFVSLNA